MLEVAVLVFEAIDVLLRVKTTTKTTTMRRRFG